MVIKKSSDFLCCNQCIKTLHLDRVPQGSHTANTLGACGFWPWDFPRDSIHHSTPSAFPNNVPVFVELTEALHIVCLIYQGQTSWVKEVFRLN